MAILGAAITTAMLAAAAVPLHHPGDTSAANAKRQAYLDSKRRCPWGSRDGDVLVAVKLEEASGHAHARRLAVKLAERLAAETRASATAAAGRDPDPESAEVFLRLPALKAHLHNETIERLLGDDVVELVEAECAAAHP